jgi:bacteriocin-like protein
MKNSFDAPPSETLTDEELANVQGGINLNPPRGPFVFDPEAFRRDLERRRQQDAYQATAPEYSLPASNPTDARTLAFPE